MAGAAIQPPPVAAWQPDRAITPPTLPRGPVDDARLWQIARDFEAMAIGELLKPMFDTVDTSQGMFGGGAGEAAWKPMLVQEMARRMAAHGGLGLARSVHDALLRLQEGRHP